MNKDFLPRLAFVLALLFFAYLGGFATSQWKWFPYGFLSTAFEQAVAIQQPGAAADHHIHPARHDFAGARTADGAKLADGCVLVTGYWGDDKWLPGLRLLDRDGTVLHRWNADPLRIWPESPHRDGLRGGMSQLVGRTDDEGVKHVATVELGAGKVFDSWLRLARYG